MIDSTAILALISDLYNQIIQLQREIEELKKRAQEKEA
jgi:regulator of replication initiation timing